MSTDHNYGSYSGQDDGWGVTGKEWGSSGAGGKWGDSAEPAEEYAAVWGGEETKGHGQAAHEQDSARHGRAAADTAGVQDLLLMRLFTAHLSWLRSRQWWP